MGKLERLYYWWLKLHVKYGVTLKKDQIEALISLEGKYWRVNGF